MTTSRSRWLRAAGITMVAGMLIVNFGSVSAKPDPAPFTPGNGGASKYGPCRVHEGSIPWKCLDAKRKEAIRLGGDAGNVCRLPAVSEDPGVLLYWHCAGS